MEELSFERGDERRIACADDRSFFSTRSACGDNTGGELGVGDRCIRYRSTPIATSLPIVQVVCGVDHTFFVSKAEASRPVGTTTSGSWD